MIVCYIKNQKLSIAQPQIVADSINYLECKFVFQTADWLNAAKIAHFSNGAIEYTVPIINDKITADKHLNLSAGEWSVYVHGNVDGTRITTNVATLKVIDSGIIGNPLPDVPLTWQEQTEERITYLEQHGGGGGEGGENGATFIPNVSADGIISWTNDKRLPNPEPVNIKGKDGKDGKDGINGVDGYTPQKGIDYFDGENGRDGQDGSNGADGGYYTPNVNEQGLLSWTPSKTGMPNVQSVNIKGEQGEPGTGGTTKTITGITVNKRTNGGYLFGDVNHDGEITNLDLISMGSVSTSSDEYIDPDVLGELFESMRDGQIIARYTISYSDDTRETVFGLMDENTSGGGEVSGADQWEKVCEITIDSEVASISQDLEQTYKKIWMCLTCSPSANCQILTYANVSARPGAADIAYIFGVPYGSNANKKATLIGSIDVNKKMNFSIDGTAPTRDWFESAYASVIGNATNIPTSGITKYSKLTSDEFTVNLEQGISSLFIAPNLTSATLLAGAHLVVYGVR